MKVQSFYVFAKFCVHSQLKFIRLSDTGHPVIVLKMIPVTHFSFFYGITFKKFG